MNILNDRKLYGVVGHVGKLSIVKIRCRQSKFEHFRKNTAVVIKISRGELQLDILGSSVKRLKNGELAHYVTFAMICPHQYITHMLIVFKTHDMRKLQEKISQLQLDLGMLS